MESATFPSAALDIEVRFAETDAMGVVHHAAYIVWFELGRVAWMTAAGVPYTDVVRSGHHFAVIGLAIQYRGAVRFGESIRLETTVTTLRSRQVSFSYRIYNESEELVASGHSDHICVDLAGRSATIPAEILQRLGTGQVIRAGAAS